MCHGFIPDSQHHYDCLEVLNNVWECVRCRRFARNGVRICSLTLQLSFSMSCMLSSLNYNHLQKAFLILWYQTMQVYCLMCQVQLIIPVGLHRQRNVCCKTWHKKPGTEVCIGCHTLYWQFYHQWTEESWCVEPACCVHSVVPRIVCESRDIAVIVVIVVAPHRLFRHSTPFVPPLTDITFTPNVKQFITKLLHFGNLNVKHKGKRICI